MASRVFSSLISSTRCQLRPANTNQSLQSIMHCRSVTTTETGAIVKKPARKSFGLIKVGVFVVPFVYLGAMISREGAAWLEDNDIFSPEDDD